MRTTNRATVWMIGLSALLLTGAASAQNRRVDRVLDRQFPGRPHEIVGDRKVNGVTVYAARIPDQRGDTFAEITEEGEFLTTRTDVSPDRLPRGTRDVLDAMARAAREPERLREAHRVERTTFQLDLDLGRRPVRAEFDATGRLYRILNRRQMHDADDVGQLDRADRRAEDAVRDVVRRYFETARVHAVFRSPDADDFYVVKLATEQDRPVTAVVSDRGELSTWQIEIEQREVPRAVLDAVGDAFGPVEIERAMRVRVAYYRVERPVGSDRVAIDIRPTGEIFRVQGQSYRFDEGRWDHRRDVDHDRDRR